MDLNKEMRKLKDKIQNDFIVRLNDLVDAYVDKTSDADYQMTEQEKNTLSEIIEKLNNIEYREMLKK